MDFGTSRQSSACDRLVSRSVVVRALEALDASFQAVAATVGMADARAAAVDWLGSDSEMAHEPGVVQVETVPKAMRSWLAGEVQHRMEEWEGATVEGGKMEWTKEACVRW